MNGNAPADFLRLHQPWIAVIVIESHPALDLYITQKVLAHDKGFMILFFHETLNHNRCPDYCTRIAG